MTIKAISFIYPLPQDCEMTEQDKMIQGTCGPPPPYHINPQKNSTPKKPDSEQKQSAK